MDKSPEPLESSEDPARQVAGEGALGAGSLLTATEVLEDPNFRETIVLLCRYDRDGAYGLVLNRPSHMPLREIFENPPRGEGSALARRVYIGGPVQSGELQVLELGDEAAPESVPVAEGVHVGGRWDSLETILSRPAASLRLFLGYAGWGPGQLEGEIAEGAWEVLRTDLRQLLETPEEEWAGDPETLRRFLEKG